MEDVIIKLLSYFPVNKTTEQTIAEFAENDAIIDMLKEIGVDYAQGYGVAMPALFE